MQGFPRKILNDKHAYLIAMLRGVQNGYELPDWIEAFCNRPRKVGATEYWDDRAVVLPVSNEPLTLAELRGMDGEPAWCEDFGCWGIVRVDPNGNWKNKPFLLGHLYGAKFEYDIDRRGLKLYRYKP